MPSVKSIPGPYRLFFYSFDCDEPKHIHVQREKMLCKFWLEPVHFGKNGGFSPKELNSARNGIRYFHGSLNPVPRTLSVNAFPEVPE
jgi:hypothetical protein